MANGYSYITPAVVGTVMFPGESFDPTMTVEGSLMGRPIAPAVAETDQPSAVTAASGFTWSSINWAVVLIVVGLAIIVAGRE